MYYYIFDIKKCKKRSQVESIKSHLSSLGISGEFTYPSAAQTVDELVELGLKKEYTTIVAIGGDEIANRVANKLLGKKEAMGFIPIEEESTIASLIGAKNWKEACEILRYRKITEMRVGKTASDTCFLTEARLELNNPVEVTLEFRDFIAKAKVKSFVVSNFNANIKKIGNDFLDVTFSSIEPDRGGLFSKISGMFSASKESELSYSLIRARSLRIFAKQQIPIMCGNHMIAKTPQLLESSDEELRLITAKNTTVFWEQS